MALYVATSKAQIYARQIVEHFGLAKYFERVFGAQLDGTRSDKTELLRFVLVEIGETAPATMIGDRSHNAVGATNNHLDFIGVSYGYGTCEAPVRRKSCLVRAHCYRCCCSRAN
jgi:phosphoglycolate phosphatase